MARQEHVYEIRYRRELSVMYMLIVLSSPTNT
jgi:hypothetical protein